MGSIWRIDNNCGHNVARYQVCRKRSYSGFRQYNPTKPAKYRLYVSWWLWVPFAVLPTLVWWCGYSGWCPDKEQSGAQHSAGAGQTKTQLGLWRGRCSLASWRWALPAPHSTHRHPCLVTGVLLFIPHSSICKPPWLLLYCLIWQPWAADAKLYKVRSEAGNY